MEKKAYIKPEIEVVEMVTDVIMTGGSFNVYDDPDSSGADTSTPGVQLASGRRGKWGDLWYVEED